MNNKQKRQSLKCKMHKRDSPLNFNIYLYLKKPKEETTTCVVVLRFVRQYERKT